MKRFMTLTILLLAIYSFAAAGDTPKPVTNEYVKFKISLKEKSLKAGSTGNLLISLQPKKGIHVNLKPPIKITFDSTSALVRAGAPTIPVADTFLNSSKPIQQRVALAAGLKPGKAVVKGSVTYFYCSDADGWCSRFIQPFELAVNVVK